VPILFLLHHTLFGSTEKNQLVIYPDSQYEQDEWATPQEQAVAAEIRSTLNGETFSVLKQLVAIAKEAMTNSNQHKILTDRKKLYQGWSDMTKEEKEDATQQTRDMLSTHFRVMREKGTGTVFEKKTVPVPFSAFSVRSVFLPRKSEV
jgi:hypothetical protein